MNFQLLHQHAAPSNNLFHLCMEQLLHNVIPLLNYCLLGDSLGWESTCASLLLQWWCIVHLNSASKITGRVFGQYNRNKLHSMPYTSSMLYKKPSLATARRPNISLNKRLKKKKKNWANKPTSSLFSGFVARNKMELLNVLQNAHHIFYPKTILYNCKWKKTTPVLRATGDTHCPISLRASLRDEQHPFWDTSLLL